MNHFFTYLLVGILFVAPGEFLVNILAQDKPLTDYVFALLLYLALLAASYKVWRVVSRMRFGLLSSVVVYGTLGLLAEWFILGNSPAANPHAFQLGMFAWWASVFTIPWLFLEDTSYRRLKRWAIGTYIVLSAAMLSVALYSTLAGALLFGYGLVQFLIIDIWYIVKKWQT